MSKPAKAAAKTAALKTGDHLYLVDGSGYLFRAYHDSYGYVFYVMRKPMS